MSDKLAWVCLFHGGKFVHCPMLEYVGGKTDLVQVNINSRSYESFISDIENGVNTTFQHLYFKFPGKSIEDGLRYIWNDSCVVEEIFNYLHHGLIEIYGENSIVDEGGEGDGQGVSVGVDNDASQVTSKGACNDSGLDKDAVFENEGNLAHDGVFDEDEYTGMEDDEYMVDDDDDDETNFLADVIISIDDDDHDNEELLEARKNIKEFRNRATKYLIGGEPSMQLVPPQQPTVDVDNVVDFEVGYQTEYYETDEDEHLGSDLELENDNFTRRRSNFPRYDPNCAIPVFIVFMIFDSSRQFKEALIKYSVVERREIKFIKNEKKCVRAKCVSESCPWRISGSIDARSGSFHVKTYHSEHTCSISFKNNRVTSSWLANHYLATIKAMPTIKTIALRELIKEQLGLDVSISQCTKAKLFAYKVLMGNYKKEYAKLWDYAEELRMSNPGSTVTLKVEKLDMQSKAFFERMYICFAACKKGFIDGCRKVVGLDGCFLKGICQGQILCAVGRDGNDQMFPIAWAVVRVESRDTWTWFLTHLMYDLNITHTYGQGWVIISDKQKGLLQAVAELLPTAEHRMCARHIYANWSKKYKGIQMQRMFWQCAKSNTMAEYDESSQALKKISPAAYHDLVQTEPKHWSRAFFSTDAKCDIVDNNLCEAFNGRIIDARYGKETVVQELQENWKKIELVRLIVT
ncbi:uncharacterized protein LOC120286880 [Eucalyptus grandis]|uniref:uncharacterized protein LOC120286880 n=1 Tax=Eucalyptus grandis TaxID=71139 RepID=UPI00192EC393|nr:uncharacterized protein LOC120286880 [Eucalyptus grandis]